MKKIRFSLKLFLLSVACLMVACGVCAERASRQHNTVIKLGQIKHRSLSLEIWYDGGPKSPSDWFAPIERKPLSFSFLHSVHTVSIPWNVRDEADLRQLRSILALLRQLPKLSKVYLCPGGDEFVFNEIKKALPDTKIEILVVPIVG